MVLLLFIYWLITYCFDFCLHFTDHFCTASGWPNRIKLLGKWRGRTNSKLLILHQFAAECGAKGNPWFRRLETAGLESSRWCRIFGRDKMLLARA